MTTTQLVIICVTVLLLAAIPAGVILDRERRGAEEPEAPTFDPVELELVAPPLGSRVVVHKTDGQALQGELSDRDAFGVKLDQVELLVDGQARPVAGAWYLPADRIDSVQEL